MDFINNEGAPSGPTMNDATIVPTLAGDIVVPLLVVCAFEGGAPTGVLNTFWATIWPKDHPGTMAAALVFATMGESLREGKIQEAIAEATRPN